MEGLGIVEEKPTPFSCVQMHHYWLLLAGLITMLPF